MVVTGIIILVDQWKKQTTYQVLQSDPFEVLKWPFLEFSDLERRTRYQIIFGYTLRESNVAMNNSPFIDDVPIKTSIYRGFSISTFAHWRKILESHPTFLARCFHDPTEWGRTITYDHYSS